MTIQRTEMVSILLSLEGSIKENTQMLARLVHDLKAKDEPCFCNECMHHLSIADMPMPEGCTPRDPLTGPCGE